MSSSCFFVILLRRNGCRAAAHTHSSQELKSPRCRGGWCGSAENAGHGTGGPNRRARNYMTRQEAQLSQRDRAMLRVIDYFAKSLNVTENGTIWKLGTVSYSHSILYGSIMYRFRDRDIDRKSRFFHTPCNLHSTPTSGSLHRNIAVPFSAEN